MVVTSMARRSRNAEAAGITTYLPVPQSGAATSKGLFPASQFTYDAERDLFVCPQGEELTFRGKGKGSNKKEYRLYRTFACGNCALRKQCTKAKRARQLRRQIHEAVLDG